MPDQIPVKHAQAAHRPFAPDDTLPSHVLALLQRIRPGTGIEILDNGDGTLTIQNTCCDTPPPSGSIHTLTMAPILANILEGEDACWSVTLNAPVAHVPLTIAFTLAGDEQVIHTYPAPTANFAVGGNQATVCVPTVDDAVDEPNRQLILQPVFGPRLTGWTPPGSQVDTILVLDNDGGAATTYAIVSLTPSVATIIEGQAACWDIVLDRAVVDTPLTLTLALSGDEQAAHGYPAPTLTLPVSVIGGRTCVVTTDDTLIEADRVLTLTAFTDARVTAVPAPASITVRDNDAATPRFGAAFAVLGGQCCVTTGASGTAVQYVLQFEPNGDVFQATSCAPGNTIASGWGSGSFQPGDYEIEVSQATDQGDAGGAGAWFNLGVRRTFIYEFVLSGVSGGRFIQTTLTIRRAIDQAIVAGPTALERIQLGVNTECV